MSGIKFKINYYKTGQVGPVIAAAHVESMNDCCRCLIPTKIGLRFSYII